MIEFDTFDIVLIGGCVVAFLAHYIWSKIFKKIDSEPKDSKEPPPIMSVSLEEDKKEPNQY